MLGRDRLSLSPQTLCIPPTPSHQPLLPPPYPLTYRRRHVWHVHIDNVFAGEFGCAVSPCENNGTCQDVSNPSPGALPYQCLCHDGKTGSFVFFFQVMKVVVVMMMIWWWWWWCRRYVILLTAVRFPVKESSNGSFSWCSRLSLENGGGQGDFDVWPMRQVQSDFTHQSQLSDDYVER